jgi:hypothetical protein
LLLQKKQSDNATQIKHKAAHQIVHAASKMLEKWSSKGMNNVIYCSCIRPLAQYIAFARFFK